MVSEEIFENVDGRRTDAGVISLLYTHTVVFGSGKLKQMSSGENADAQWGKRRCPVGPVLRCIRVGTNKAVILSTTF